MRGKQSWAWAAAWAGVVAGVPACTVNITDDGLNDLTLENQTGSTWSELFVASSSASGWGNDRLFAGETVPSGNEILLTGYVDGTYDIRAESSVGCAWERRSVSLIYDEWITLGAGDYQTKPGTLAVTNNIDYKDGGDYQITELYIKPDGSGTWGSNLLTSSIAVGASRSFEADCGIWDTSAVDASGNVHEGQKDIKIISGAEVSITITELD